MTITVKGLKARGGSCPQLQVFAREWPEGVEVTEANLLRAAELGLDLGWFARKFLPLSVKVEYQRQEAPLWAEYWRQEASLWAEFKRPETSIGEYLCQVAPLRAEYKRQIVQLTWALWPQGQEGKEEK